MTKKQKRILYSIIISAILFMSSLFVENSYIKLSLSLIAFLVCGGKVIVRAAKNIVSGNMLDENFLMTVASVGAFFVGEISEGVAVMLFYQIGELFESIAVSKSRKSISEVMDICPEHANVFRDGEYVSSDPAEVVVGDTILIKPGERIPIDCVVLSGKSDIDTRVITGESAYVSVSEGDTLISGSVNVNGVLTAQATCEFQNSAVSKILELVENAGERKSKYESFIHRFAIIYTPVVVALAIILAIVPPLFLGDFSEWIHRSLTFLVVSCPCALVISVPLSFFGGLGRASSMGILIKGAGFLEAISKCSTIVFDKTGTLTTGSFYVDKIYPYGIDEDTLLQIAASAENCSNHPVSVAIKEAYKGILLPVDNAIELAGRGISVIINEKVVLVGNTKLMEENNIEFEENNSSGTIIHISEDGVYLGSIAISDRVKENAKKLIEDLNGLGINRAVMLTGDRECAAKAVADEVGISEYYSSLLPQDKVDKMAEIISQTSGKVVFAGDGINDAPVLAMADISVSMGVLGSDAAIEASDIVLTDDNLMKIPLCIKLANKTLSVVRQNIVFTLSVKFAVLVLSALGFADMWAAVFADVGVAMLAILNAMKIMNKHITKL